MPVPAIFEEGQSTTVLPEPEAPTVSGPKDYAGILPGRKYTDPNGTLRQKPPAKAPDPAGFGEFYNGLPEGSHYIDPQGATRVKPESGGLSIGAQILYDMARTPQGKRDALTYSYGPDAVMALPKGDLAIKQKDGRVLKPGRGPVGSALGYVVPEIAPMAGAVGGELLGSAVGAVSGPGALATGALGAGAGLVAGDAFNDMILSLIGIDTGTEQQHRERSDVSALVGAGGSVAGRAIGAAVPVIGSALSSGKDLFSEGVAAAPRKVWEAIRDNTVLPRAIGYVTGAEKEPTEQAARLSGQGVLIPPSAWLKESPYLQKVVEQFDPLFRMWEPLKKSAGEFYERSGKALLARQGITPAGSLLEPTAAVSSQAAGETVLRRVAADTAAANTRLDDAISAYRESRETLRHGEEAERTSRLSVVTAAEADARALAQETIDLGLAEVKKTTASAMRAANADQHPGALWQLAGEQLDKVHLGIETAAARIYSAGHAVAGKTPLVLAAGQREAMELLETLPADFRNNFPELVRKLERLGKGGGGGNTGVTADQFGVAAPAAPSKPATVTLEELHELRNLARSKTDRFAAYADLREGLNRKVAGIVNRIMHDPAQPAQVKAGVRFVDQADAYYGKNIRKFNQEAVDTIVSKMRNGFVDDAPALAKLIFDPASTVNRENVRKLLGPQLWRAVHAADVDGLLRESVGQMGEIDAGRFAGRVMDRVRSGVWTEADLPPRVVRLAEQVSAIQGKIPIEHLEGDTVGTLLRRAADYGEEAKALAKRDPLGTLASETKKIAQAGEKLKSDAAQARRRQPLGFLENASEAEDLTAVAMESADRIVSNPNLMIAAARRFGRDGEEFVALQKVAVQRLMQTGSLAKAGRMGQEMAKLPPEVQEILFPGVSHEAAMQLAKDMEFLIGRASTDDFGGSLAGASRVLNPATTLGIHTKLASIPGVASAMRYTLGAYYKAITYAVTHPGFIQWINKGLQGSPAEREVAGEAFRRATGIGGAIGAGAATPLGEQHDGKNRVPPRKPGAPIHSTSAGSDYEAAEMMDHAQYLMDAAMRAGREVERRALEMQRANRTAAAPATTGTALGGVLRA